MTGINTLTFGTLAHDLVGYTVEFNGDPMTAEDIRSLLTLLRGHGQPRAVVLTGRFPEEHSLYTIATLLRDDGHQLSWVLSGNYLPACRHTELGDYTVVRLTASSWLVHPCNELWWNGEGEEPALPSKPPMLYLECDPRAALRAIKTSRLLWHFVTKQQKVIKEVLYDRNVPK